MWKMVALYFQTPVILNLAITGLAAADIPVASDNPVHYADAIRCNVERLCRVLCCR